MEPSSTAGRCRLLRDRAAGSPRSRPSRNGNNVSMDSFRGQLLIASPALLDPNFRRTVVLVTEHGEEGAAGLVLNRP